MIPIDRTSFGRAAFAAWLGFAGLAHASVCDDDGSDDLGNLSGDFTNSACVQGSVAGAVKEDGGGGVNLPPFTDDVQAAQGIGGIRHPVSGTDSTVLTAGKPVNHPIRPGQEYKVTWTQSPGSTVGSLHSKFAPKGLPAGYQVEKNTGDGWVPGNQIDVTSSSGITVANQDHRFRVLRPIREPGQVGELMMTPLKLMEARAAAGGGNYHPGVYPVSDPQVPAFMATNPSAARFVMALGAALEDGRMVTAGDLVFHCPQPGNVNAVVNPSFLSFEGPDKTGTGVWVTTLGANWIRQIRAPEIFVDVIWNQGIPPQNVTSFELKLYPPSAVAGQTPSPLYSPTGSPHTTWTVERINASGGFAAGVRIRKFQDGVAVRDVDFAARKVNDNHQTRRREGVETEIVESSIRAREDQEPVTIAGETIIAGSNQGWTQERTQTSTVTRNGTQVSKTVEKFFFASGGMGEGLYERRQAFGTGGGQELVSQFWYNWFAAAGVNMGTTLLESYPDGSWVKFSHGPNGLPQRMWKPYEGQPVRPWDATDSNCVLQTLSYDPDPYTDLSSYNPTDYEDTMSILPSGVETFILGTQVSRTASNHTATVFAGQPVVRKYTRYFRNDTDYEEDDEDRFHETSAGVPVGMPASRIFSTGERHTISYERGDFNPATRVFTPSANGLTMRVTKTVGTSTSPDGIAHKTTRTVTVRTGAAVTLQEATQIYTGSGYETATVTDWFYDVAHRLVEVRRDGRTIRSIVHNGLTRTITGEDGQKTVITEDLLGRITSDAKEGGPTASTAYNANTKTTTIGTLTRSVTTDLAGRETSVTGTDGRTLGFSYPNNGRDRQITYPGSRTVLETRHPGGILKSVTNTSGQKIVPRHYTYGKNPDGSRWTKEDLVTPGNVRTTTTTTDWQGNEIATEIPAPNGSGTLTIAREYEYGLLRKETVGGGSGLAPRLFEYDAFGEVFREGRDFNGNGTLDPASNDPIIEYDRRFEKIGPDWYGVREVRQYQTNGNATPTTLQIVKSRLNALSGGTAGRVIVIDANGVETVSVQTIDRPNKTVTTVTSRSDRNDTATQVEINGLLKSSTTSGDTAAETYDYDSLERLWKTTDARTGAVTSRAYNAQGLLQSITEEALPRTTTWNYHAPTHANAGQVSQVINADGKSTYFSYNDRGQLVRVWGAAAHPEEREYNAYGDLTKTTSFRAGSGWTAATWPGGTTGAGDTTTYEYDPATGLLKERIDALGRKAEYTWHNNGNLHTRKWARNVTTTWNYNASGLETSRTYSGGTATPAVTTTRDRAGRAATMTDASGLRTYARNAAGLMNSVAITGSGILSGYTTTIGRDGHGRPESATVVRSGNTLYSQTRTWQPGSGRLRKVVSGAHEAEYLYAANSDLIREIIWRREIPGGNGETAATLGLSRLFDDLGRVTSVRHIKAPSIGGPELVGSQTYDYDILDRRQLATFEDGSFWDYDYNDRGELLSADKKLPGGGSPYAGQQFRFTHDNAGNRLTKENGGNAAGTGRRTHTSTANALNQRASQATPATFDVIGFSPAPTVTVNGTAATRQGDYFRRELTAANGSAAAWTAVTVSDGGTPVTGNVLTPQASVTPAYDDDGNLLSDGVWTYTWDAENRLVKAVRNLAGIPYREVRFDYDGNDRLIQKRVYHASGGSAVVTEKYLHESGRRLLTVNASNQAVQSFHWGLDVSGTQDNAAGAGGLLWIHDHDSGIRHLVCTDGNANVTHLVNAANGQITAAYEYSPHGELLRATGSYAFTNPFRFSTKAHDDLTGLLDYGQRFYKPDWGIWLSRDPAGDIDGLNLYGFCGNDPVNRIDVGGYFWWMDSGQQAYWKEMLNPVSWAKTGAESVTDPNYWNQVGDNGMAMGRGVYNGAKAAVEGVANLPELADFIASGDAFEMIDRLLNDPAYQEAMMNELGKEFCEWLRRLQSNDGAFEMYGEGAFAALSGTGLLKLIKAAHKVKLMGFSKKVPTARALTDAEKKTFGRVTHRKGLREEVWERSKAPDGKVYDPSGVEIKPGEPFDLGHVPGHEFSSRQRWAADEGMTRKDWLDYQNDPDIYRPELPRSNQGHNFEDPWYDVR